MPEFNETLDGNDKQDCERNAAKRWLASEKIASIVPSRPVFLGDALFACQPIAEAVKAVSGADFVFVVKPEYHKALFEAVENASAETLSVQGPKGVVTNYRFTTGVPLRNSKDAMTVDFCEITMTNASGKVTYRNAFVTSLTVDESNVVEIVQCGRTRWKIENESFNVLKNHGYNLAHSFGHGKNHLAKTFAALNLLAFSVHGVCDVLDDLWKRTRKKAGKRTSFFNEILYACNYFIFESWNELFELVLLRKPPASSRVAAAGP